MMDIHLAALGDAEHLARLIRAAHSDVAARFGLSAGNCPSHPSLCSTESLTCDMARGTLFWIGYIEGEAVGCVGWYRNDNGAGMKRLSVLPAWRRQGVGAELVRNVIEHTRRAAIDRLEIGIVADQVELQAWYHRLGFCSGEIRRYPQLPFAVMEMHCPVPPVRLALSSATFKLPSSQSKND